MGVKDYMKRTIKFIFKGIPQNNVKIEVVQKKAADLFIGKNILITGGGKRIRLLYC